jgi:hypothetical protein
VSERYDWQTRTSIAVGNFIDWLDDSWVRWTLVFLVVAAVILTPIIWVVVSVEQDQSARCAAHGWEHRSVKGGGLCVRPDGVLVEVPAR